MFSQRLGDAGIVTTVRRPAATTSTRRAVSSPATSSTARGWRSAPTGAA
jgi:hypothetical protein